MQISALAQRLLRLMFALSPSAAALTRPRLEQRLDQPRGGLNRAFDELSRLGLLDAKRLRLTLSGLALAVALSARGKSRRPGVAQEAALAFAMRARCPLFSEREAPRAVA